MAGTASTNPNLSSKEKKEVRKYLDNIDPGKVEKVYGKGKYTPWHGDGKSQSQTNVTFQTKSQETSGKPPIYITIVAIKGKSDYYVKYESSSWEDETAEAIINAMIAAL